MTETITFGILLPFYHGDRLSDMKRTLRSVLFCDFSKVYIVVDGPIHHASLVYLNRVSARFDFELLHLCRNAGLGAALNFALPYIKETYCFRIDPGDVLIQKGVSTIMDYVRNNPQIDLVGGQMAEHLGAPDQIIGKRQVPCSAKEIRRFAKLRNPFNHITVCFNVVTAKNLGGYPEDTLAHEDYGFWIKYLQNQLNFTNLNVTVSSADVSGFSYRRSGVLYAICEFKFLIKNLSFFHIWVAPYILIRLPARASRYFSNWIYSKIRSQ